MHACHAHQSAVCTAVDHQQKQHHRVDPGIAGVLYLDDRLSGEAARVPQSLEGLLTPADTTQ